MKVSFIDRFIAYVVDTIIIGFIGTLICLGLPTSGDEVKNKMTEINDKYVAGEITNEEFYKEYSNLTYDSQKETIMETVVSLVLTIGYFVVFQYMNKGQTIGKKLFNNIRVVNAKTKKNATMFQGALRSIITLGIVPAIFNLTFLMLLNKEVYMPIYYAITAVESIFILVTVIMIIKREDGRGLHDLMAGTMVIKEGR